MVSWLAVPARHTISLILASRHYFFSFCVVAVSSAAPLLCFRLPAAGYSSSQLTALHISVELAINFIIIHFHTQIYARHDHSSGFDFHPRDWASSLLLIGTSRCHGTPQQQSSDKIVFLLYFMNCVYVSWHFCKYRPRQIDIEMGCHSWHTEDGNYLSWLFALATRRSAFNMRKSQRKLIILL